MSPDELMAAAILAELLNARAEVNDHPALGPGRYDWRLTGGKRTYAVEVTSHSDQDRRLFDARSAAAGGIYRDIPGLAGIYSVQVEVSAVPSMLWSKVPALIRDHFPEGVKPQELEFMRWNPNEPRRAYAEMLLDLGVLWISAALGHGRSGMQISAGAGWFQHSSVVAEAVAGEFDRNRAKLAAATDADERHLFVWVHQSALAVHFSLRDEELPTDLIDLGPGIDVLWVAGVDGSRRPSVVWRLWRVRSNEPWEDWTSEVRSG